MTVRSACYSLVIVALAFASMGGDCTLGGVPMTVTLKPCDVRPTPVTFQAEAGCGPGGQIVVQSSRQYPEYPTWIDISNTGALGFPPSSADSCIWISGGYQGQSFKGDGGVCPIKWDEGSWEFTVQELMPFWSGDCSGGGSVVTLETCSAVLADGGGSLTCQPGDGGAPCTSILSAVGDGGTK